MNIRDRIIVEANKLKNAPFRSGGNSSIGIDCIHFVGKVYKNAGILNNIIDTRKYNPFWWSGTKEEWLIEGLEANGFVTTEYPIVGDIATFRLYKKGVPVNHCSIIYPQNNLIHAKCGIGRNNKKVTVDFFSTKYMDRFAFYFVHQSLLNNK